MLPLMLNFKLLCFPVVRLVPCPAGEIFFQMKSLSRFLLLFFILTVAQAVGQPASAQERIDLAPLTSVTMLPAAESIAARLQSLSSDTGKIWTKASEFRRTNKWDGSGEYWYKLDLKNVAADRFQLPVIVMPFVIQALSVYSDGREIYSWGLFKPDGRIGFRGYPIHLIPVKNVNLNQPLFIRVGSGGANIGIIDGIFLAERGQVTESYFWLGLPNLGLFILALLIGSLSLFAFAAIRENKTLLAYGLFAIVIGTFVGSHSYTLRLFTDWAKLRHSTELFSLYLSGLTFSFYLDTIFGHIDKYRILNKSWKFYALFAVAAAVGELTQWAPLFKWLRPWQLVTALIFLTVPYFTIKSMLSKSVESYFVGGGLLAFTMASFAGVIFSVGGGAVTAAIFHFFIISGVFLLLVGLGGLIVYRHYDTNRRVIEYQKETAIIREAQARQEKDMEAARAVQQTLLPLSLRFPGFETAAHWTTADQTGGDWYSGYFDEKSGVAYLFLGDVTGHGFASALVTGLAHGAVSSVFKLYENDSSLTPAERLQRIARGVNHVVFESASRSVRAMSMVCLAMNSATGDIHLINCGHPQVYLIKQNKVDVLLGSGSLLGFHAEPEFEVKEYKMEEGDRLFVYTDGVLENGRNEGKAVSFAKLRRALNQSQKSLTEIHSEVVSLLKNTWQDAPIEDDYTLVLMQWGQTRSVAT
ncbi:MAG: hypothetical protein EBR09_05270 [Proteobacteria bacterium]|nr:hypothetical protein [Pseudomonadota bacterium]